MDYEINRAISFLRNRMEQMKNEERIKVMNEIMDGYCINCGMDIRKSHCYCTKDE
jgi:hypothetical protein